MSKRNLAQTLFRQQAIDAQRDRLYGSVILKQPLSYTLTTIFVFIAVGCIAVILIYGKYSRRESVSGYLVPDKGLVKIYAPVKGILLHKHVSDGLHVSKGERLFTISRIRANDNGSDTDAVLLKKLEQQRNNLVKKITQEKLLNEGLLAMLDSERKGIIQELKQLELSISLQSRQLHLFSEQTIKLETLHAKGHIPEIRLDESNREHLNIKISLQVLKRQKVQLKNSLIKKTHHKNRLPIQWRSLHSDLLQKLSEIEQRIVEISDRRVYSIYSPVNGRLTALQISEGQTISTQLYLIAIIPENSKLQAELFLPTRAVGFIKKGQKVFLRYQAFPYQHYGLYEGQVKEITRTILNPRELPAPLMMNEPAYRVLVNIDEQAVDAYGKKLSLQSGMLLSADIVLEERTLGQWLIEPVYRLAGS